MAAFIGELDVRLVDDDEDAIWGLLAPLSFQSDITGKTYTAATGFTTDFMSVPRFPGLYEKLGNRGRKSGVIHDWLYKNQVEPRGVCDEILKEMLLVNGFDELDACACYTAVRAFGGSHY
jgi:hypothetical protein